MKRLVLATVASVLMAGGFLSAHHAYADFDRARVVTIDGVLEELVYGNPHVMLKVRTASGIFIATWDSANVVLRRANFTATTFHVGDRLLVSGSPAREASRHELALLTEVVRPSDGWKWSKPRPVPPPSN